MRPRLTIVRFSPFFLTFPRVRRYHNICCLAERFDDLDQQNVYFKSFPLLENENGWYCTFVWYRNEFCDHVLKKVLGFALYESKVWNSEE